MSGKSMTWLAAGVSLVLMLPLLVVMLFMIDRQAAAACPVASAGLPVTSSGGPAASGGSSHGRGAAVAGDSQAHGGQVGSGMQLGAMPVVHNADAGVPVSGRVAMAVANLPTTHGDASVARRLSVSLRSITRSRPDFIALNEITRSTPSQLAGFARGYGAYRDPVGLRGGSRNSMENAVMWDATKWHLVDGGRFMFVKDDWSILSGKQVVFNRYAIWTVLRRASDGAQVVVISTHMMTNPQKFPRRWHSSPYGTRIQQFAMGMKLLRAAVVKLAAYGPVLIGGDMNVHPDQGGWSTPDQLAKNGFAYTVDGVDYQFFPHGTQVVGTRTAPIISDHHRSLITTIDLNGAAANDTSGSVPVAEGQHGPGAAAPVAASSSPASCCPPGGTAAAGVGGASTVAGLDADQLKNAKILVSKGIAIGGIPAALAGVTAALTESDLHTDPGSTGGAYGLMQQTPPAWGTKAQVMDPNYAAEKFYEKLIAVPGWQAAQPWHAAQMVQRSGAGDANGNGVVDPEDGKANYGPRVAQAQRIVDALAGGSTCATDAADTAGRGSGGHFAPSTIDHVGKFTREQLLARMAQFIAHNHTRDLDPFFHSQSGSWYRACQHFVANLSGASMSGYGSAAAAWSTFRSRGVAHPASGPDGMAPPPGAWLYYGPNHVVVYLGNNQVASTDTWGKGTVNFGAASAETDGPWHLPYLGWVAPWGGK